MLELNLDEYERRRKKVYIQQENHEKSADIKDNNLPATYVHISPEVIHRK